MLVFYPFNGVQELGWCLIYKLSEMFNQESNGWIHKLWLFCFNPSTKHPPRIKDGSWFFCDGDIYREREASIFGGFWFLSHDIMARYILPLFLFFLEGGVRGVSAFKLLILKPMWQGLKHFSFWVFLFMLQGLFGDFGFPNDQQHVPNSSPASPWEEETAKLVTDTCQFSNHCEGGSGKGGSLIIKPQLLFVSKRMMICVELCFCFFFQRKQIFFLYFFYFP